MLLERLCVLVHKHEMGSPFGVGELIINCLACVCVHQGDSVCVCVFASPAWVDANTRGWLLNSNQRDVALQFSFRWLFSFMWCSRQHTLSSPANKFDPPTHTQTHYLSSCLSFSHTHTYTAGMADWFLIGESAYQPRNVRLHYNPAI